MTFWTRANATMAYLVAVLLLGGASAAGVSGNLMLQLLGAGLVAWTLWEARGDAATVTGLRPFFIALAVLGAVQFLPLPPGLWRHLPGREAVFQGFARLGVDAPWLTLSLSPWHGLSSFAWWIPAFALFVSLRAPGAPSSRHVIWTITAAACLSVAFSAMQTGGGSFYFYEITNYGEGPGFFANSNHQGSFLLCAMSFWGCWAIGEQRAAAASAGARQASTQMVQGGVALLLAFGVIVSGSLACQLLLLPVLGALALVAFPDFRLPLPVVVLACLAVVAGLALILLFGPAANDLTTTGTVPGISRQEFLKNGLRILRDFAPLGSGTGTFVDLYRWYEDPAIVGTTFVNHAHDDLLETLIETGVFGLAAVAVFLGWYVPRAWALWGGARRGVVALAASLTIGVELVHSLVDYPLRTAAMSAVMAIACVLLVRPVETARAVGRKGRGKGGKPSDPGKSRDLIRI